MNPESSQTALTRYDSMHPKIEGRKDQDHKQCISFIRASAATFSSKTTELSTISPTPPPSSKLNNKDQFIQTSFSQRNAGKLPPTVDSSLIHQCQSTRLAFSKALANDQLAASEPKYRTAFTSANDVVKRLLPYHVWHVRDEDIMHILNDRQPKKRLRKDEMDTKDYAVQGVGVPSAYVSNVKNRKKSKGKSAFPIQHIAKQYPSIQESDLAWQKYVDIHSRAKVLLSTLTGAQSTQAPAPFAQESRYHLEKMAWEEEREALVENQRILRVVREDAIAKGVPWSAILPILTGEKEKDSEDESDSEEESEEGEDDVDSNDSGSENEDQNGTMKKGESKAAQHKKMREIAKPRGRPRKERDEYGRIIRPPASIIHQSNTSIPTSHTGVQHKSPISDGQAAQSTNGGLSVHSSTSNTEGSSTSKEQQQQQQQPQSGESTGAPSSYVIPSQPIRLVLPFSTLTQLSALGIHPVPAPHLLPAIAARQASTTSSTPFSIEAYDTAPRPSPIDQQEPALLMGFTSTSAMKEKQAQESSNKQQQQQPQQQNLSTQNDTEMIHVSLVLSKLGPSQLSGLATLMQRMQANGK